MSTSYEVARKSTIPSDNTGQFLKKFAFILWQVEK